MNGRIVAGWVVVLVLGGNGAWGDELAGPAYGELVRQLGSPEFGVRQVAEQKLLRIGSPAKSALLAGRRDADMEIRLASQRILICVAQQESAVLTEAFLGGDNKVSHERFPGWPRLCDRLGDTRAVRQLYVEMLRSEPELLQSLERADPVLMDSWSERLLLQMTLAAPELQGGIGLPSGPALFALLFVGVELAEPEQDATRRQALQVLTQFLLTRLDDQQVARLGMRDPSVQRLLAIWAETMSRGKDGSQSTQAILIALKFALPDLGCRLARAVLRENRDYPSAKPYAAIALARFGTAADALFLVPHLQDTRVFHTWSNPQLQPDPIQIQVRDVILAMLLRMRGRDPATCGFELLDPFPETVYRIWTCGFLQEPQRVAAFEKWHSVAVGETPAAEQPADSPTKPTVADQ